MRVGACAACGRNIYISLCNGYSRNHAFSAPCAGQMNHIKFICFKINARAEYTVNDSSVFTVVFAANTACYRVELVKHAVLQNYIKTRELICEGNFKSLRLAVILRICGGQTVYALFAVCYFVAFIFKIGYGAAVFILGMKSRLSQIAAAESRKFHC